MIAAAAAAAAALALSGMLAGGGQALVGGVAGTVLSGVQAPALRAVSAALVVAVQQARNDGGTALSSGMPTTGSKSSWPICARRFGGLPIMTTCMRAPPSWRMQRFLAAFSRTTNR
jgi:hypothetical protein